MRIQTSLEFLLALSVVGLLIASAVAVYGNSITKQRALVGAILQNESTTKMQANVSAESDFGYIAYMPSNSTVGEENNMQLAFYGCGNGTAEVNSYSNSVLIQGVSEKLQISNIGIANIGFEPIKSGVDTIVVTYNAICGGYHNGSVEESTFSSYPSSWQGITPYAAIYNRSEKIAYATSAAGDVYGIKTWSHCTIYNFWYNPLPVSVQCGTSDAWSYMMFSNYCYTMNEGPDSTTCIVPVSTGYNVISTAQYPSSYIYSIGLSISMPGYSLNSQLKSGEVNSNVTIGSESVGNASVEWVSGSSASGGMQIIQNGTALSVANSTAYSEYAQAMESMSSLLSYYNSTAISGSVQSLIQASIAAYTKSVSNLISTRHSLEGCSLENSSLTCAPSHPFDYGIDARISMPVENTTVDYEGSEISIGAS
ncbi:MAG: hypothetical protein ACP5K9_01530 [Candidatus Micrarchaeia archaeon]